MDKVQINHQFREMYAKNEEFDESVAKKNRKKLYNAVIAKYGDWDKALKLHGVTKKRLKERKKYFLYQIMRNRYEKFGEEALRPKNIEEEMKKEIVDVYDTLKNLNRSVKFWNDEKTIYELRSYLLAGFTMESVKEADAKLYQKIEEQFGSIEEAKEEYLNRFGLKKFKNDPVPSAFEGIRLEDSDDDEETIEQITTVQTEDVVVNLPERKEKESIETPVDKKEELSTQTELKKFAVSNNYELLRIMKNLGYINEKQEKEIKEATSKTNEEIENFLFNELIKARSKNERISEEKLKKENLAMYIAVVAKYGTVSNAVRQLTTNLLATF